MMYYVITKGGGDRKWQFTFSAERNHRGEGGQKTQNLGYVISIWTYGYLKLCSKIFVEIYLTG